MVGQHGQQLEESLIVILERLGASASLAQLALQQRQHDGAAIRELAIQRSPADLCALHHQIKRRRHAMLGKDSVCRIQQLGAAFCG